MSRKPYKQRERRYVPEYVNNVYAERIQALFNVAVGPAPEDLARAYPEVPLHYFNKWRFYIDAIVITETEIILIEGKLRKAAEGIGQILLYETLLEDTPELKPYWGRAIRKEIVTARPDPRIIKFAEMYGINLALYRPPWAMEYLRSLGLA